MVFWLYHIFFSFRMWDVAVVTTVINYLLADIRRERHTSRRQDEIMGKGSRK